MVYIIDGCEIRVLVRRDRDKITYLSVIPQAVCIGQSSAKGSKSTLLRAACSLVKGSASLTMPLVGVVIMLVIMLVFLELEIDRGGDETRGGSHV